MREPISRRSWLERRRANRLVQETTPQLAPLPGVGASADVPLDERQRQFRPLAGDTSSLSLLGLRRRWFNALARAGFKTIGQVAALSRDELHRVRVRSLGQVGVEAIDARLADRLLLLGDAIELSAPAVVEPPPSQALPDMNLHVIPISRLGLPRGMDAELEAKGLRTVGQVLADLAINPHSQTIYQALKEYQEWLAERPAHVQVAERTATGPSPLDWEALRRATPAGMVAEWLAILDERKRTVIRQRFGFDGPVWTLIEIGRRLDVSRERARQVESQALRQLKRYYQLQIQTHRRHALTAIASLLHHQLVTARGGYLRLDAFVGWLNAEGQISLDGVNPEALIRLLCTVDDRFKFFPRHGAIALAGELPASLPSPIVGGKTGQRAPASPPSTRHRRGESQADLLARALESFGCPAHVADIARRAAELPSTARAPKQGTALQLLLQSDALISLGEGVFSLVAWERARAAEPRPVLPVCPRPWADVGLFHDQFFESVFAGREYLAGEPTAIAFVADMLGWWGVDTAVRPWVRQSVLAAYYLVGLSPYAFPDEDDPPLRVDLPLLSIADTRRHCLRTLTARLAAMPGFWGLLRARGPARPKDLAGPMAARHPLGLVDVEARLHLLAGLGAVERLSTGLYRLTPLGETCAAEWGQGEAVPERPRQHAGNPFVTA